jgi:hypothetical protein
VCEKMKMKMCEFASQIPSPFIHTRDFSKNVVQSTPTLTRGPGACQLASMGQPVINPRRQGTLYTLHVVRGSHIGSETVVEFASSPMTPATP